MIVRDHLLRRSSVVQSPQRIFTIAFRGRIGKSGEGGPAGANVAPCSGGRPRRCPSDQDAHPCPNHCIAASRWASTSAARSPTSSSTTTPSGRRFSHKELTTHDDPGARRHRRRSTGVLRRASRSRPRDVGRVVHATTLFTNALIERKGASHRAHHDRRASATRWRSGASASTSSTTSTSRCRAPLVPRRLRLEVPERIGRRRQRAHAARRGRAAASGGATGRPRASTSLAVAFLHAYANPAHERRGRRAASRERFPTSARPPRIEVAPEIREYERTSTTVVNAYIKPLAERYLDRLAARDRPRRGIAAPLLLMLSNGGLTHIEEAKRDPVQLLESGPAAGALAAAHLRRRRSAATRAGVRHGRHDGQARDRRRRQAAGRLQLRGRAREALRRRQRPAGPHLHASS